jgi:integrase
MRILPEEHIPTRKYFKLSELAIVWKYAFSWQRAVILLALNCGFANKELATLQYGEIITKKGKTYIRRTRHKTNAPGLRVLWPETIQALEYLGKQKKDDSPYAVTGLNGQKLDRLTKGGNDNGIIKNGWNKLMDRISMDHPEFHRLPFKCLRKTGSTMVRHIAKRRATELASMYLAHGGHNDSADPLLAVYAGRPWGKLQKVISRMRSKLLPIIQSEADTWEKGRKIITPKLREKVMALRQEGKKMKEIGRLLNLHKDTVSKITRGKR